MELFWSLLAFGFLCLSAGTRNSDPAANQLPHWDATNGDQGPVLTAQGSLMESQTASLTTSPLNGPIFLDDTDIIALLASFARERVPERTVHAKGAGAHGVFKVTHDLSDITKAGLFGKPKHGHETETEVFVRLSTVIGELGAADTVQDARGFAVKFYTREGVMDIMCLNTPGFPVRDPVLFPSLIHSRKRNPQTHLPDPNSFWDFVSLRPETTLNLIQIMSDLGLPDGFRFMNAFAVNAYKFINSEGDVHYAKFHFLTEQGIRNLTFDQAVRIAGEDPNYSIRDLYNAIAEGNYPSWKLYVQVLTPRQAAHLPGAFDAINPWNQTLFPLRPVGVLTLNRNPKNFFAEVEQVAYDPSNLVPGIDFSPDRLLQGRSFIYRDTQRHRIGANFEQLPINRPTNVPLSGIHNYMRDGPSSLQDSDAPNYFPNSFGGPRVAASRPVNNPPTEFVEGFPKRTDSGPVGDNFSMATALWEEMDHGQKRRLVHNVLQTLSKATEKIQKRTLREIFSNVSSELERRVSEGLRAGKRTDL